MSLSLVVCADDFALNPGVSRAIVELAELGRISATSAMVCAPHWQAHAPWLRDLSGHIGVGLHLDLTSPWAQRESHGQGLGRAIGHSLLRLTDATTAEQVIANQLDRFEQVWRPRPITSMDTSMCNSLRSGAKRWCAWSLNAIDRVSGLGCACPDPCLLTAASKPG